MNKEQALTKLAALEAETKALRAIIEAPDVPTRWRPRGGEKYSQVVSYGAVRTFINAGLTDQEYEHGNCFQTEAQAEIAAKAVSRTLKMCAAAFAVDPDAGGYDHNKRSCAVYNDEGEWRSALYTHLNSNKPIYVHTQEQARQMAAILNAEGV